MENEKVKEKEKEREKKTKRQMMESDVDIKDIVVIDNGTDTIKVGVSGEDQPRLIYDTCCGIPAIQADADNPNNKPQLLFGQGLKNALQEKKYNIQINYPIEKGRIEEKNLDKMKEFWTYCLEDGLQISELSQVNLLIIDQVSNSKEYKFKMAEIFFQELKVKSVLFMNASTLSLFSTGCVTGLSIELGHALNTVVPIYQGYPIAHALQCSPISGDYITKQLLDDLKDPRLEQYDELKQRALIKDIKENMCYIADNYQERINGLDTFSEEERSYQLPDEQVIQISPLSRYKCGESLFNPKLINYDGLSLQGMITDSINRCDDELKHELVSNMVLGGGSSMYKGLLTRLKDEVSRSLPLIPRTDFNYIADFQRKYSAWIGGSMIGSLDTFQELAIKRGDFEENPESKLQMICKRTF